MTTRTNNPCFGTATEAGIWVKRNCLTCAKYTAYNTRLKRMPKYKCAVQRDIELQQNGTSEISERSYRATLDKICPYFKGKTTEEQPITTAERPTPIATATPINIEAEAERMRNERIEAERKETEAKALTTALETAEKRRQQRMAEHTPTPIMKPRTKAEISPEVIAKFREKGKQIKIEIDDIARQARSNYHITTRIMIDIAESHIMDVVRELKATGRYKQELKRQINKALEAYKKVSNTLDYAVSNVANIWQAMLDEMTDRTEADITKLYYSLKQVLDRHNIANAPLKAKADIAYILLTSAAMTGEIILRETKKNIFAVFQNTGITPPPRLAEELAKMFAGKDPHPIAKEWEKACNMICGYPKEIADEISKDTNVSLAVKIIHRKLADIKAIDEMSYEILQNAPELQAEYEASQKKYEEALSKIA